jgi:hypothetical protein
MENANELLGILHGAYGLGGTIAPLIATAMVTKAYLPWYTFYYMMVSLRYAVMKHNLPHSDPVLRSILLGSNSSTGWPRCRRAPGVRSIIYKSHRGCTQSHKPPNLFVRRTIDNQRSAQKSHYLDMCILSPVLVSDFGLFRTVRLYPLRSIKVTNELFFCSVGVEVALGGWVVTFVWTLFRYCLG